MKKLWLWLQKRRLDRAQELIERSGLSVVMFKHSGDTTYLVNADGTYLKLSKGKK